MTATNETTDRNSSRDSRSTTLNSLNPLERSISKLLEGREWLAGCDKCSWGLIDPPPPVANFHVGVAEARLIQFMAGELQFCDCKSGESYRRLLAAQAQNYRPLEEELAELRRLSEERRRMQLFETAGVPPKYREFTFKSFLTIAGGDPGKQTAIRAVRLYFENGSVKTNHGVKNGILIHGEPGVGKTGCLSPLFVYLVREKHASGLWVQYNELLSQLRDFESGAVEERMRACQTVDYLFIDDFGDPYAQKSASDYSRDVMFRIIDYRNNHGLPMFVTTNLDLEKITDQFDRRIVRRLADSCVFVRMTGAQLSSMSRLEF